VSIGLKTVIILTLSCVTLSLISAYYAKIVMFDSIIQSSVNFEGVVQIIGVQAFMLLVAVAGIFAFGTSLFNSKEKI